MAGWIGQPHLFVLALHLHQQSAGAAQQCHTYRLIVDEGTRPAILADDATKDDILLSLQALFGEQRQHRVIDGWGKARGHAGLFGPGAHQPGIGPCAQREAQTIQ